MRLMRRFLKCYFHYNTFYRFEFFMQFLRDALMMYCNYRLWNVLYQYGMNSEGMERLQMVTYGVFGAVVTTFITRDGCQKYIKERIRQGTVDGELLRPVDLQVHMLMRDLSQKLARLLQFTLPTLCVFLLATRLFFIPEPVHALLFLLSFPLAYLVLFDVDYLLGMLCFQTLSIESISFAYTALISFFAGQLIPLWMLPGWAENLVNVLPFRCIFDIPMGIYIGRYSTKEAFALIGLQILWASLLWLLGKWGWRSVKRNVISQGG